MHDESRFTSFRAGLKARTLPRIQIYPTTQLPSHRITLEQQRDCNGRGTPRSRLTQFPRQRHDLEIRRARSGDAEECPEAGDDRHANRGMPLEHALHRSLNTAHLGAGQRICEPRDGLLTEHLSIRAHDSRQALAPTLTPGPTANRGPAPGAW